MPGRSPNHHSPVPSTSRSSPGSRGRMRSPDRHRTVTDSSRPGRSTDFRTSSVRRSRSPIEKARSLSPPIKKNSSPKRENPRRLSPPPSRSKRPVSSSRSPGYKTEHKRSDSANRSHSESYKKEGGVKFDVSELKRTAVLIKRSGIPGGERCSSSGDINRAITNPEEITIVRRPDEGTRPIFMRPELMADSSSRDVTPDDECRRIAIIQPDREPSRSIHYEDRSRPHYSGETREQARSPGYSTSRKSPTRSEYYKCRDRDHEERRGSSRDNSHHELEVRRHDDGHYPERRSSYDREKERVSEKRSESHHRHDKEDHHRDRNRRRSEISPPPREGRRGSLERRRPSRDRSWERENGVEKRTRTRSRSRSRGIEDRQIRESGREHYDEFQIVERPRRYPPAFRGYFQDPGEYIPVPVRGPIPVRRGLPGPPMFRGRPMLRGAPIMFHPGVPFIRGVPPRGPFIRIRGGFVPRFYPPF